MRSIAVIATTLALAFAPAVQAREPVPAYLLTMKLLEGGKVVGIPVLKVKAGEPATIKIDDAAGHRYEMQVTASPSDKDTVLVQSSIDVASGDARYAGKPALLVKLGQPSAIEIGEQSATAQPFHVDFTVTQTATH